MTVYRGIFTPLVTPLDEHENLDLASLHTLVDWQVSQGVHGFWAMGTTSEFASFDADERAAAIETVVRAAAGRVPVIANISDASTRLAIRHGRRAGDAGADAVAATPPYYYPHSQDELLTHYRAIHQAIDLPLFIYNIPQTVKIKLEQQTARALAAEGTVAGIKDSQNDLEWLRALTLFTSQGGYDFWPLAGTRHLIDAALLAGATGAVPSIANAFPDLCIDIYRAASAGEWSRAADGENRIIAIESLTGIASSGSRNAATIGLQKAILQRRGIIASSRMALPLRTLTGEEQEAMLAGLDRLAVPLPA